MVLLVGLGNPGPDYAKNRHNIGFMAVDNIVQRYGFSPWRGRFHGQACEGQLSGRRAFALKPETYMNESGRAVVAAMRYYRFEPENIIVLYDEIDLEAGKVRCKQGGGNAGHNGLRSIDSHIGRNYVRVRLGVGHPGDRDRVSNHVLGNFSKSDMTWVNNVIDAVGGAVPALTIGDIPGFSNQVALRLAPAPAKSAATPTKE
ncbi:MAG: aminoacyl-tRNA hydrolase [Proteobacteria bacterium]|nr:aminoacyl-tRNA hydrolase [Pseudomonadota bacterium]MDA1058723.1 aminoacyl-tRNA hydrolase [Pseudomonadota bacterium]